MTVKTVTLIFISWRGVVKRENRFYLFGNELISCLSRANKCAFHENPKRIFYTLNSHLLTLKAHITKSRMFLLTAEIFDASKTKRVGPDQTAPIRAI